MLVFVLLICILACLALGLSYMGLFVPLGLDWLFPFPHWGNFQLEFLQKFPHTLLSLFFFWDPYNLIVCAFDMVPEVSETVLNSFILFTFFCSSEVVSSI